MKKVKSETNRLPPGFWAIQLLGIYSFGLGIWVGYIIGSKYGAGL